MRSFKENLSSLLKNIKKYKYEIFEQSTHHIIYTNFDYIVEVSNEAYLTKKMKEFDDNVHFVVSEKYNNKKSGREALIYYLRYHRGGDVMKIAVEVKEKNERISFESLLSKDKDEDKNLIIHFIEELKKLPKYRLINITQ
jgi:hypothetical protein